MLFQVEENCDLAAFTIGYKLDSSPGLFSHTRHVGVLRCATFIAKSGFPIWRLCRFCGLGNVTVLVKLQKEVAVCESY